MPVAWHPKRWWNFCMSEDENRFLLSNAFNVYKVLGVLGHFDKENYRNTHAEVRFQ